VTNHISETLARFPLDNRVPVPKPILNSSILDRETSLLREKLRDPSIDSRMVAKIIQNLSEKDILDFADYALRKARNPGRAFVKLCYNAMQYKTLDK
jgi:hypothetical protein